MMPPTTPTADQPSKLQRFLLSTILIAGLISVFSLVRAFTTPPPLPRGRLLKVGDTLARLPPIAIERSVIVIGYSTPDRGRVARLAKALRTIEYRMMHGAEGETRTFSTVGVALDADVTAGLDWLRRLGAFSEVSIGRGWGSTGATAYIWSDTARPVIPQVIAVEREVDARAPGRLMFVNTRILRRALGYDAIDAWAADTTWAPPYGDPRAPLSPDPP
jgi:hypothetical protein